MPDHATSDDPAVQAQLDRLFAHGPGTDTLGLDRITRLLARLDDPHRRLPPVFHVAGTNGKGSTCAFLRAALEAAGHRVHAYTSPHLVRFNERIRMAGKLINDDALAPLLADVLDAARGLHASFFEVTSAAAFLAFARTPADACVIEVGLGGRLDATNVLETPLVTGIAALGLDHEAFLLAPEPNAPADPLARIAWEKAGIAKPGVPLVTLAYPPAMADAVRGVAEERAAPVLARNAAWRAAVGGDRLAYHDAQGALDLPLPALVGPHQTDNAALAVAMLRHQSLLPVDADALATGLTAARWPARMQRLLPGPLRDRLPAGAALWVDGAHNPSAAAPAAAALRAIAAGRHATLVVGMLANKDAPGVLSQFVPVVSRVIAVPVPGHPCHDPMALANLVAGMGGFGTIAPDLPAALDRVGARGPVLIAGSLYLAGEALRLNEQWPD